MMTRSGGAVQQQDHNKVRRHNHGKWTGAGVSADIARHTKLYLVYGTKR